MKVKGGYYFDDFLKQGAKTDSELSAFIMNKITRGLMKMEIKETDIGCSSFTATAENGDKLFARNYDFDKTNVCITLCNPGGEGINPSRRWISIISAWISIKTYPGL